MNPQAVHVRAGERVYRVLVGTGLLAGLGEMLLPVVGKSARKILIVLDDNLPELCVQACRSSVEAAGFDVTLATFSASESNKRLAAVERLLERTAMSRLDRNDVIVALGGGITGDVAGLVAAMYKRGVRVIQCPTTLLAMVDASVGGKTGVNLLVDGALLKNYSGAFHQPELVVASMDTLDSLPQRQFRAGLAECIKHAMISADWGDGDLWEWTEARLDSILDREPETLTELVARNVAVKARLVEADERETLASGGRSLLNLGHTFAHAIETLPGVFPDGDAGRTSLLHGEAVALGLIAASEAAVFAKFADRSILDRVRSVVSRAGLPTTVRGLPPAKEILTRMAQDKKAIAGTMRLILPVELGRSRVVESPPIDAVLAGIDAIDRR
ncbi:MAG: 3-dehydroquinate synthase [Planctomycetota bacterium]|nr:MAG: 3-dehydroquinate synthase [Planctomycetota bacterium]